MPADRAFFSPAARPRNPRRGGAMAGRFRAITSLRQSLGTHRLRHCTAATAHLAARASPLGPCRSIVVVIVDVL